MGPQVACEEKKWHWAQFSDEAQEKLRQWEMFGGPCLKAGFVPVSSDATLSSVDIIEADSSRFLAQDMKLATEILVPLGHEFITGQNILLCTNENYLMGTIRRVEVGSTVSRLNLEFPTQEVFPLFPQNSLVVGIKPFHYQVTLSENPPEKILYEKHSDTDQRPVQSGFETFLVRARPAEDRTKLDIKMEFSLGDCKIEAEYPILISSTQEMVGKWWIKGKDLVLERWTTTIN